MRGSETKLEYENRIKNLSDNDLYKEFELVRRQKDELLYVEEAIQGQPNQYARRSRRKGQHGDKRGFLEDHRERVQCQSCREWSIMKSNEFIRHDEFLCKNCQHSDTTYIPSASPSNKRKRSRNKVDGRATKRIKTDADNFSFTERRRKSSKNKKAKDGKTRRNAKDRKKIKKSVQTTNAPKNQTNNRKKPKKPVRKNPNENRKGTKSKQLVQKKIAQKSQNIRKGRSKSGTRKRTIPEDSDSESSDDHLSYTPQKYSSSRHINNYHNNFNNNSDSEVDEFDNISPEQILDKIIASERELERINNQKVIQEARKKTLEQEETLKKLEEDNELLKDDTMQLKFTLETEKTKCKNLEQKVERHEQRRQKLQETYSKELKNLKQSLIQNAKDDDDYNLNPAFQKEAQTLKIENERLGTELGREKAQNLKLQTRMEEQVQEIEKLKMMHKHEKKMVIEIQELFSGIMDDKPYQTSSGKRNEDLEKNRKLKTLTDETIILRNEKKTLVNKNHKLQSELAELKKSSRGASKNSKKNNIAKRKKKNNFVDDDYNVDDEEAFGLNPVPVPRSSSSSRKPKIKKENDLDQGPFYKEGKPYCTFCGGWKGNLIKCASQHCQHSEDNTKVCVHPRCARDNYPSVNATTGNSVADWKNIKNGSMKFYCRYCQMAQKTAIGNIDL